MEIKKILEHLNYEFTAEEAEQVLKINSRSSKEEQDYFMKNLYAKGGVNSIAKVGTYVVISADGKKWVPENILQYPEGAKAFAENLKKSEGITEYEIIRIEEIINEKITKIKVIS